MIKLTINGRAATVDADPDTPLLWAIREQLALTGTKYGCGIAACGACTVHLDGAAVRSCSFPLGAAAGHRITTIEGLSHDRSHPLQQAWIDEQVPQCGYCQSGMIMAAAALLARDAASDRSGHRCGDHQHLSLRHLSAHPEGDPCGGPQSLAWPPSPWWRSRPVVRHPSRRSAAARAAAQTCFARWRR
jgi:isoquinoline 1-oxidoreductase alpha subunit